MQTERSINTKLAQQLDKLPMPSGFTFDKEAAWQKLYDRLLNTKRKRTIAIITTSLSIAVAASVLYLFLSTGNIQQEPGKTAIPVPDHSRIVTPPSNMSSSTAISIEIDSKKSTGGHSAAKKRHEQPDTNKDDQKEIVTTIPIILPAAIDTVVIQNNVAKAPEIKKKMKVVHYNELGEPTTGVPDAEKNVVATVGKPGILTGFRKPGTFNFEEIADDTIRKQKPKRSILPFSSHISQKE